MHAGIQPGLHAQAGSGARRADEIKESLIADSGCPFPLTLMKPPRGKPRGINPQRNEGEHAVFESLVQATYEAILTRGDIAIDVGAHVGRHAIPMATKVYPNGQVFAFEPLPMCRAMLEEQLTKQHGELAKVITTYSYALSDYDGEAEFVLPIDAPAYSGLKQRIYDTPTRLDRMSVMVRKLDSLFLELPSLKYIKIDAEGGEFHVLKGAIHCLRKFRPLITFEFGANSISEYGITPADMAAFLASARYKVYDIRGRHLSGSEFIQSALVQDVWDYIAIPSENGTFEEAVLSTIRVYAAECDHAATRHCTDQPG